LIYDLSVPATPHHIAHQHIGDDSLSDRLAFARMWLRISSSIGSGSGGGFPIARLPPSLHQSEVTSSAPTHVTSTIVTRIPPCPDLPLSFLLSSSAARCVLCAAQCYTRAFDCPAFCDDVGLRAHYYSHHRLRASDSR
jgi:hypothetical protein